MANDRNSKEEIPGASDLDVPDSLSEAMFTVEQGQAALGQLRDALEEAAARLQEVAGANAAFESVADRLVAATLKASEGATHHDGSQASVTLVEDLADLARSSLMASGKGRSQLREYEKTAISTKVAVHVASSALDALSALLKQLAASRAATPSLPPIEVETRPPPLPMKATTNLGVFGSKPSPYKN